MNCQFWCLPSTITLWWNGQQQSLLSFESHSRQEQQQQKPANSNQIACPDYLPIHPPTWEQPHLTPYKREINNTDEREGITSAHDWPHWFRSIRSRKAIADVSQPHRHSFNWPYDTLKKELQVRHSKAHPPSSFIILLPTSSEGRNWVISTY